MKLSIGIMMKNEEKYIKMCLEGLRPLVEKLDAEIIIIDTGSTDNSIEIAKEYTDKVYSYEWNNDFSEIRNKLISLSRGKWYLSVDADEILVNDDKELMEKKFKRNVELLKKEVESNPQNIYESSIRGHVFNA